MASIRKTKKSIRYVCGDIAAELLIASHAIKDFNRNETVNIINDIASLQCDALAKCSFDFDKAKSDFENGKLYRSARRKYASAAFHKLNDEIGKRMQEIVDKMNAAMPQHIKDAAKA
ncbi:MAG: hypothetical protein K2I89_04420 [Muribaculaceae bacterium]|nr:hypothetical protein [Muribaculaceae bacterium]